MSAMKKTVLLGVFVVTSCTFAMNDNTDQSNQSLSQRLMGKAVEIQVYATVALNKVRNYASEAIITVRNSVAPTSSDSEKDAPLPSKRNKSSSSEKSTDSESQKESTNQANTTLSNLPLNTQEVSFQWLNKKNALLFGVGAIALVFVGYSTYVLYKNGTLKKVGDAMKQHPYKTASSVTGSLALGGFLAYKYLYAKPAVETKQ